MSRIVYVGPTIIGVATRNTIYSAVPESITEAAKTAPYLLSLCVPVAELAGALAQIDREDGYIWTFYKKALTYTVNKS